MNRILLCLGTIIAIVSAVPWPYGEKPARGVNLGGWLVLEKWITPDLFKPYPDHVKDEYTLTKHLGKSEALRVLRQHWESWVTENEIIELKNAGINHLRIPFGHWALESRPEDPYVQGSWDYMMRAVGWAKKHGLQVMADLHGVPGSQNGFDNSGREGSVDFFSNDDFIRRAVNILGQVAQIFNAPEWRETVTIIQLLNEPVIWADYWGRLGKLKDFYGMAYKEVRKHNPNVVIAVHDAFIGAENWYYLRDDPSYYWVMLDVHHYQVFNPDWKDWSCDVHDYHPCSLLGRFAEANSKLWTVVGEWSLATPKGCTDDERRIFARNQIGVYETASGWMMWNFKHGGGWTEWDFLASHRRGWIPQLGSDKVKHLC